jgi:hypothetical protein
MLVLYCNVLRVINAFITNLEVLLTENNLLYGLQGIVRYISVIGRKLLLPFSTLKMEAVQISNFFICSMNP